VTKNIVPGESVYGEKRIAVEGVEGGDKTEYRVWNPFRSKVAAAILGGVDNIHIKPGCKLLYLGGASGEHHKWNAIVAAAILTFLAFAPSRVKTIIYNLLDFYASGTTVSHCSDVVGPEGTVYAVEFSHRSGEFYLKLSGPELFSGPFASKGGEFMEEGNAFIDHRYSRVE